MSEVLPPSRIAVLPPDLADQIAAGEVVERAASVVKELCENSIDAGARRIDVEIEAGGRRLIRVVDDGGGMTPDEARLALRRHATSKLRAADDLWRLSTFGFRGEALPSIAAVSRLSLSTKTPEAAAGIRLTVEAGIETGAREIGIPAGTQIEVRDLFFNTPARLKFQKTESTEAANATEAIVRLALAHPEVHFRLKLNGRMALDMPPHGDLGERVRAALARRGAGALHETAGQVGGHDVRAFLGAPAEASGAARSAFLYVGRRYVRDRALLHAVTSGYGDLVEKGRYPLSVVFVDVPADELDINVHPQKLEVRFSRATEVYAAVRHIIASGVERAGWGRDESAAVVRGGQPEVSSVARATSHSGVAWRAMRDRFPMVHAPVAQAGRVLPKGPKEPNEAPLRDGNSRAEDAFDLPAWSSAGPLRFLGPFGADYVLFGTGDELLIIDPHGVRERRWLERLRGELLAGDVLRSQKLLFPMPVDVADVTPALSTAAALDSYLPLLGRLGFQLCRDGKGGAEQILVGAIPHAIGDVDPKPLLVDLLDQIAEAAPPDAAVEAALAVLACHAARREPAVDDGRDLLSLADDVQRQGSDERNFHGRRIAVRVSAREIEHLFERD